MDTENTEKYKHSSDLIKKEKRKNQQKQRRNYKHHNLQIKIFYGVRFMVRSISDFVDNLSEGFYKIKCTVNGHDNKNCEEYGVKSKQYEYHRKYLIAK